LISKLRVPLPAEAISRNRNTGLFAIKAAYVVERLNEVFGLNGWRFAPEVVESGRMVVVKGALLVPAYDIHIEQFGGNDHSDRGDAYKGACTDALSKCASYLEIGIEVYKGLHNDRSKNPPNSPQSPRSKGSGSNSSPRHSRTAVAPPRKEVPTGLTSSNTAERFSKMRTVLGSADYNEILGRFECSRIEDVPDLEQVREIYRALIHSLRKRFDTAMRTLGREEYIQILRELHLHPNGKLNPEQAVRVFNRMQETLTVKE
jgi:hypothetical protein